MSPSSRSAASVALPPCWLCPLPRSTPVGRHGVSIPGSTPGDGLVVAAPAAPGDVITGIAGRRVDSVEAFLAELRHHRPDDSVEVQLLRDGQSRQVTAKLSDHP